MVTSKRDSGAELAIKPVSCGAELDRFIALPNRINADDPNYIAPLFMERRQAFQAKTNPFFAHADVQFWLATRNGQDVGRISAQIDHLAPQNSELPTGHFGLIGGDDDPKIFAALFGAAEKWLADRDKKRVLGPFNLSINEEVGILVDGFDTPPMLMMGHDPQYAGRRVEEQGYSKAMDVYAYQSPPTDDLPANILRLIRRSPPKGVRLRQLNLANYDAEVVTLTEILNDAWSDNWGFTETTAAETKLLAKSLRSVIDPRLTWFAEIDGESAGFIVFVPNVNEAIADLNGKLLPFGWAKLLWRLKVKGVSSARCPLMGVRRKFSRTHRGKLLPFMLMDAVYLNAREVGFTNFEASWILETNSAMRHILEAVGSRIYKTYRLYEKTIG